jgi:hypothetical protein
LGASVNLTGSNYAGLTWEPGLSGGGYNSNTGEWATPTETSSNPIGSRNVINYWGALSLGISFDSTVDVNGAYFAMQGSSGNSTTGVRAHGYLNGVETSVTNWFTDIDATNSWFDMNLTNVDRVVIESQAVINGGGWYGMDNFTYNEAVSAVPVPAAVWLFGSGIIGLVGFSRRKKA